MEIPRRIGHASLACFLAVIGACASNKAETDVSAGQMSAPARATMERVTAGGHVEKVTREVERGRTVYDVEANVGGKHVEYVIAESDGAILGTENEIAWEELPDPVRAAAQKHFDAGAKLRAMKGVEYGETTYELEGLRDGKTAEATFDPSGKREP